MSEKEQKSSLDALIESMDKRQKEDGIVACNLDADEGCESCSG